MRAEVGRGRPAAADSAERASALLGSALGHHRARSQPARRVTASPLAQASIGLQLEIADW